MYNCKCLLSVSLSRIAIQRIGGAICLSSSCLSLCSNFESLSLNTNNKVTANSCAFKPLCFPPTTSFNLFSTRSVSKKAVKSPRRRSTVCKATDKKKKPDSAAKRARQSEKMRIYHKAHKSQVRTRIKKVLDSLELLRKKTDTQPEEVITIEKLIGEAYSEIDKAVKVGTLHRKTGARRKSRLARRKKAVEIHHGWCTPSSDLTP